MIWLIKYSQLIIVEIKIKRIYRVKSQINHGIYNSNKSRLLIVLDNLIM
jgi:hypothetical protein